MKLNHRLLITSGLLLAMSTVAMSTATYAWFTTTRQSQIELNTITIQQDSNLEMEIVSINGVTSPVSTTDKNYGSLGFGVYAAADTKFTSKPIQDVSGDGATFFKPNIASDGTTFTSVTQVTSDLLYNYVNEIVIGFRSDKAYEVYLNGATALNETPTQVAGVGDPVDNHLSQAARVAFFDRGSSNDVAISQDSLKGVIVSDVESGGKHSFITSTSAKSTTVLADGSSYAEGYSGFEAIRKPVHNDTIETKISSGTGLQWCVTTLATKAASSSPTGHEQFTGPNGNLIDAYMGYVTVRIWVEGTDEQCTGNARYGKFSVTLDFNSYLPAPSQA